MTTYGWKNIQKLTVPNNGSVVFTFPGGRPLLEKLTIWALSGDRSVSGLTFQPRINGVNFGASVAHAGPGVLAQIVLQDVQGSPTENMVLPPVPGDLAQGDGSPTHPLEFDVLITAGVVGRDQVITMAAAAIGRAG